MSLSNMESKKLLMDLKYWKEELSLKKEMVSSIDSLFNDAVDEFLNENRNLKDKWVSYEEKKSDYIDDLIENGINPEPIPEAENPDKETEEDSKKDSEDGNIDNESIVKNEKDPFLKSLYREIVKQTHPDKISNLEEGERERRIEIYKNATKHYDSNNFGELLYCGYELNIDVDIKEKEISGNVKNSLDEFKKKSNFLENTFTWKWYNSDLKTRKNIIKIFVTQEIAKRYS